MSYPGIDYAGTGATCNRDKETGIRYGVISTHSLTEWFWDDVENDYGEPTCPECGSPVTAIPSHGEQLENGVAIIVDMPDVYAGFEPYRARGCDDFACEFCKHTLDSDQVYSEDALGWSIDDGAYKVVDCLDSDAMIIKAPYYTFAAFCSPCVPGAGNLDGDTHTPDGVKCYCFGHDWFDGDRAPYPVYSVETGELVEPETKE
jgi:hypothetical protein